MISMHSWRFLAFVLRLYDAIYIYFTCFPRLHWEAPEKKLRRGFGSLVSSPPGGQSVSRGWGGNLHCSLFPLNARGLQGDLCLSAQDKKWAICAPVSRRLFFFGVSNLKVVLMHIEDRLILNGVYLIKKMFGFFGHQKCKQEAWMH